MNQKAQKRELNENLGDFKLKRKPEIIQSRGKRGEERKEAREIVRDTTSREEWNGGRAGRASLVKRRSRRRRAVDVVVVVARRKRSSAEETR